ncbi:hypothetical protein [Rheinheimera pacifica]|uniref:hypothetical protein n=1 Tax=Rheinheimera pacifica TaxID=173990 RepID=UPI000B86E5B0|nr:hypothetical protein [Rheinheimera pacifica]
MVSRTQTCLIGAAEMAEADILIRLNVEITDIKSVVQRQEAILDGYLAAKAAIPALLGLINRASN